MFFACFVFVFEVAVGSELNVNIGEANGSDLSLCQLSYSSVSEYASQ